MDILSLFGVVGIHADFTESNSCLRLILERRTASVTRSEHAFALEINLFARDRKSFDHLLDVFHALQSIEQASRRSRVEGCQVCNEYPPDEGPPHDASPRCESGRREHCTCDICF